MVSVPAAAAVFLYSWDPLSLKGHGLGELTVFVMFGPVLALGVNVAVLGVEGIEPITLWYSVPLGLLTAAVLFANNIRDIKADARAGKITLAIVLGPTASATFFRVLLAAGYVSVAALAFAFGTSAHQVRLHVLLFTLRRLFRSNDHALWPCHRPLLRNSSHCTLFSSSSSLLLGLGRFTLAPAAVSRTSQPTSTSSYLLPATTASALGHIRRS